MKYYIALSAFLLSFYSAAATTYVPAVTDSTLPTPQEALGFQVGEWHARHDQIQRYFEKLAAASGRAQRGHTRRLYLLWPCPPRWALLRSRGI